uniref:Uncharacterized protein n=1 Tax=Lepeophtheirus salmonis TaxID=72036 RepID=A0A0K2VBH1_LEPSM
MKLLGTCYGFAMLNVFFKIIVHFCSLHAYKNHT